MKKQIRNKKIEIRVSEEEELQIKNYFKEKGMNLSEYIRNHLKEVTKNQ